MNEVDKVKKVLYKKMAKSLKKDGKQNLAKKVTEDGIEGIDRVFEQYRNMILNYVKRKHEDAVSCEIVDALLPQVTVVRCKFEKMLPIYCIVHYVPSEAKIGLIDCERYTYYKDKRVLWVKANTDKYYYLSDDMKTRRQFEFASHLNGDVAVVKDSNGWHIIGYDFTYIAEVVEVREVVKKTKYGNNDGIERIAITKNGQEIKF